MDLILALDEKLRRGVYLADESLIDEYVNAGYAIYLQHPDGTFERIREPIVEEIQNGGDNEY